MPFSLNVLYILRNPVSMEKGVYPIE
jgi:hypothetical protein